MSSEELAKCPCVACGANIAFPFEGDGMVIDCPHCSQPTTLTLSTVASPTSPEPKITSNEPLTADELSGAFRGKIPKTPVSIVYQLGLMVVAVTMVILPIIYLALIGLAGYGVYFWATHFSFLLGGPGGFRLWLIKFVLYITPLLSGLTVVLFMVKPLLARRPSHAQPLALNPQSEPVLYAYIANICAMVGAPQPRRIDIDCNLNASASFRRGLWSIFGNDLVLTIGLPIIAGMNTRQFAGVVAHEFGHFTQGFGMRLTYLIRTVNAWFFRVVYERDAWDEALVEFSEDAEDIWIMIVGGIVRMSVWFSRMILKIHMIIGHAIGCFMLRQMEYDADSYQIKFAGSESFEDTMRRLHVLAKVEEIAYKDMRIGLNNSHTLPDNFPRWLMYHDHRLDPSRRTKLEDTMGFAPTGFFDTHPSNGDRIKCARQAGQPGVFDFTTPATRLFGNFDAVAKQVTHLHYSDDLGVPLEAVTLISVPDDSKPAEQEAAQAPAQEETSSTQVKGRLKLKLKSKGNG